LVRFKFGDRSRVPANYTGRLTCWIVAILKQDNFRCRTESVRKGDEVCVRSQDDEAIVQGIIPNLTIRSGPAEPGLSNVDRTRKKIIDRFNKAAGKVFVEQELHSALFEGKTVLQGRGPLESGKNVFFGEFGIVGKNLRV
jgi:hypothetical protein